MCVYECGGHRWNSQLFPMLPLEMWSPAQPGTHWSIQNVCPVTSAGIVDTQHCRCPCIVGIKLRSSSFCCMHFTN